MPEWLPAVFFVSSFVVTTIALLIVASKRWRHKRLTSEVSDLTTLVANLKRERQDAWDRAKKATAEAREASLRENDIRGQRDGLSKLYDESKREVADLAWLRRLEEDQAKDISEHVKATLATYPQSGELELVGDQLCIIVGLSIRNESVFDITIRPQDIAGQFSLNRVPMKEPAGVLIDDFRQQIENLKPMQKGWLVLEQPLREFEVEKINRCLGDDDAKFWIGGMIIPISVNNPLNNDTQKVDPKPLRIPAESQYVPVNNLKRNTKKDFDRIDIP